MQPVPVAQCVLEADGRAGCHRWRPAVGAGVGVPGDELEAGRVGQPVDRVDGRRARAHRVGTVERRLAGAARATGASPAATATASTATTRPRRRRRPAADAQDDQQDASASSSQGSQRQRRNSASSQAATAPAARTAAAARHRVGDLVRGRRRPGGVTFGGAAATSPASTRRSSVAGVTSAAERQRAHQPRAGPGDPPHRGGQQVGPGEAPSQPVRAPWRRRRPSTPPATRAEAPLSTMSRCTGAVSASGAPRAGREPRLQLASVPALRDELGELGQPDAPVRLEHVADLLPRGVHVAPPGSACTTRVPNPAARRWRGSRLSSCTQLSSGSSGLPSRSSEQPLGQRVPAAVERRGDQRVRVALDVDAEARRGVGVLGRVHGVVVGQVDECRQRRAGTAAGRGRPQVAAGPSSRSARDRRARPRSAPRRDAQRAAELEDAAEQPGRRCRDVAARVPHVDVAHADPRVDRPRLEQADEVLEVALVAGAEVPAVVVRAGVDAGGLAGVVVPGRQRRVRRPGRVEAEPGQPAGLEGRHDERVVARCSAFSRRGHTSRE